MTYTDDLAVVRAAHESRHPGLDVAKYPCRTCAALDRMERAYEVKHGLLAATLERLAEAERVMREIAEHPVKNAPRARAYLASREQEARENTTLRRSRSS